MILEKSVGSMQVNPNLVRLEAGRKENIPYSVSGDTQKSTTECQL